VVIRAMVMVATRLHTAHRLHRLHRLHLQQVSNT
jgi:hypothetical protein